MLRKMKQRVLKKIMQLKKKLSRSQKKKLKASLSQNQLRKKALKKKYQTR